MGPCSVLELLLADGRFPGGGFAHSGGLEPAVADGSVTDVANLEAYLIGRIVTAGALDGWLAAAACRAWRNPAGLADLEREAEAHQPSSFLRDAARAQGRGLRRSAALIWPEASELSCEVHPVVLGAVAGLVGLEPEAAARLAVYGLALTVAGAAAKLAPIDMADALGAVARQAALVAAVSAEAAAADSPQPRSAPLVEQRAENHRTWEVRLFAS